MLDMAQELEKTLHIHSTDLPYVSLGGGNESRILMARPEENIYAIQFRAQPFIKSPLHKHRDPLIGYTLKCRWGHDENYEYRPDTFIFETPGVVHQFINGPEITEVVFIGNPNIELVDPETLEVTGRYDGVEMIDAYLRKYEEQGAEPRFLR